MIIDQNTKPERQIYYLSSLILKQFKDLNKKEIDFFELFSELRKQQDISIKLFIYSLDWLFLLQAIDVKGEKVVKCL